MQDAVNISYTYLAMFLAIRGYKENVSNFPDTGIAVLVKHNVK